MGTNYYIPIPSGPNHGNSRVGVGTRDSHSTIHTRVQITRPDGSKDAMR